LLILEDVPFDMELEVTERIIWKQDGKEMVRVPAGKFLYGDEKEERELPEFWIDKTPVTNAEYAQFVDATGHDPPLRWKGKTPSKDIADRPVTYVSWHDAAAYAEWAGKQLPTEEEWEKAARGTDGREYPWGNQKPTPELCNFGMKEWSATSVGKYSPQGDSPYGCVDMAGNVWEWTASEWGKESPDRVVRGGTFDDNQWNVRCTYRFHWSSDYRSKRLGFRVVVVSPILSLDSGTSEP
jgi:serine/threonine-protein kinase